MAAHAKKKVSTLRHVADLMIVSSGVGALVGQEWPAGSREEQALAEASIALYKGLRRKTFTVEEICALSPRTNKDTVARQALLGQLLSLPGEYVRPPYSAAHYIYRLILTGVRIKSPKGGIPALRRLITGSVDKADAVQRLEELQTGDTRGLGHSISAQLDIYWKAKAALSRAEETLHDATDELIQAMTNAGLSETTTRHGRVTIAQLSLDLGHLSSRHC